MSSLIVKGTYFQVFDDVMKTYEKSEDYNPSDWEEYSVLYMTYFVYQWGIVACDNIVKTKAAKELLEMIKTVEFDVIVHDITLDECLYGLWEVKIKQSFYLVKYSCLINFLIVRD